MISSQIWVLDEQSEGTMEHAKRAQGFSLILLFAPFQNKFSAASPHLWHAQPHLAFHLCHHLTAPAGLGSHQGPGHEHGKGQGRAHVPCSILGWGRAMVILIQGLAAPGCVGWVIR